MHFGFMKCIIATVFYGGKEKQILLTLSPKLLACIYLNKWEMSRSGYGKREMG